MVFEGDHVVFTTDEIDEPDLITRKDQMAVVVRQIADFNVEEGGIFRIRFPDGVELDAFENEIIPMRGAWVC